MKRSFHPGFAIVTGCVFAISSIGAAGTRENERLLQGKITKNEAEHLVLKEFPGAKIKKCELTRGKDHSIWVLDVVKVGGSEVTRVQVDGLSGKILR